jgi:hypothetical protein
MNNWWIVFLEHLHAYLQIFKIIGNKLHEHDFKELIEILVDLTLG